MSIYQPKLLKEQKQDEALVAKRWVAFQDYKAKAQKIKAWKEEEYQDGFLRDLFENCLGYTLKTSAPESYNLEREKKNETDSKKADGVIYVDDKVLGIIELKDQKTKNLDRVEQQAFWYLTQHSNAKYVIISNFDEIRFYVEKSTAYERYYLFELDYDGFKQLHLLLSYESIEAGLPLSLKEKSVGFEQQISKDLYKDFSSFRLHLFENILQNNQDGEPKELLRLTQKLCDRIVFVLFAEDRGLLRANTIKEIREEFRNQKFTNYKLYDIYKFYFHAINEGNDKLDIPKYNGGLFATDEVLDSLLIDDVYLDMEAQKLSNYDFLSDVGVNILGHIFEQSLTDLEELSASIEKKEFDKTKTKRKKDGVFYTPEYITKYIVQNTLGKLCEDKKKELDIPTEIEVKNPRKLLKKEQETKEIILSYREWLKELKILDPACGSGAFLNQALEYLIAEHTLVRDLLLPYEDLTIGYEIEKEILENNLYGVDINEDATEIAKLSLWLRTAYKGRELTKLADKIVCANSLLEMPFDEGSFDVVIGNPPYVRHEIIKEIKPSLKEKYETFAGSADLYVYFYELSYNVLKENGVIGYICSNKFLYAGYAKKMRKFILENFTIKQFTNFGNKKVFEDAVVTSDINIFIKNKPDENTVFDVIDVNLKDSYEMRQSDITDESFVFLAPKELELKRKIYSNGVILKNWNVAIRSGIKTGFNEAFIIDEAKKDELLKKDSKNAEIIKPYLRGRDVKRYSYEFKNLWLLNVHNNPPVNIDNYPLIKEHLNINMDKLQKRSDKGNTAYHLRNCSFLKEFEQPKIIWIELSDLGKFTYDSEGFYVDMTVFFITGESLKYLLAILNSKLIFWYFDLICAESGIGTNRWKKTYVEQLPIPQIEEEKQQPFIKLVDEILDSKQKIKDYIILLDEAIKNDNFDREIKLKKELETLENLCTTNEKTIDEMVYKLYGLSEDEVKIVEGI